jgi:hypothetical protein
MKKKIVTKRVFETLFISKINNLCIGHIIKSK